MIGTEVLKYVDNTKYLEITFCETLKDDKDMIRQMRLLYAKSNKLLSNFSNCTSDVKLYCLIAIAHPYIVYFFGLITLSAPSANLGWHSTTSYRKIFNPPIWSSASTMYAKTTSVTLKQC